MSSNGNGLANGKNGKKRRRRIIWAAAALLILGGGGYGVKAALSPNHAIDPSKLAVAERGDLARVVVATGKIEPLSKVEVKSKASGIVKKLYVDYADRVKQGKILANLDKLQLEAAVRAATANLQAAEAALQSAKATLERNKVDAEGPDVPFLKLITPSLYICSARSMLSFRKGTSCSSASTLLRSSLAFCACSP